MKVKTATLTGFKDLSADGEPEGTFEAFVSMFGNIDLAGDRVVKGAFAKSLLTWTGSGDRIPVIWSHQWQNPEMHVGEVLAAEERDEGLWVKAQLDIADDPVAAKVWRLLSKRRVREFSFAYDVLDEKRQNGANELLELDVIEVGPTLKGMNPDTLLLEAKGRREARAARYSAKDDAGDESNEDETDDSGTGDTAETEAEGHASETGDAQQAAVDHEGDTDDDPADDSGSSGSSSRAPGRKARVTLDGSVEQLQERLRSAVTDWAFAAFRDVFIAGLEATWPDDGKAVLYVETWDQPWGGGDYHQASYEIDDDGTISLGEPEAIELIGVVSPKSLPDAAAAKKSSTEAPTRAHDPLADPDWVRAQADLVELGP